MQFYAHRVRPKASQTNYIDIIVIVPSDGNIQSLWNLTANILYNEAYYTIKRKSKYNYNTIVKISKQNVPEY